MIYLAYLGAVCCSCGQSVLGKAYGQKGGNAIAFNRDKALAAFVLFLAAFLFQLRFHLPTMLYGAAYGLSLAASMYAGFVALSCGPMALTTVIASFSLIIPVIGGLVFWGETLSAGGCIGLAILPVAVILLNLHRKKDRKMSWHWWKYALLTFLTNGICAVIQKLHQQAFPGEFHTDFMLYAMLMVLFLSLFAGGKNAGWQRPSPAGLTAGAANGIANYLTLYLAAAENATVLFPIMSIATAIAALLAGRVIFREKLTLLQMAGFAAGILSVLLLKI